MELMKEVTCTSPKGLQYKVRFIKITDKGQSWWYMTTQDRVKAMAELGYEIIGSDVEVSGPIALARATVAPATDHQKSFMGAGSCISGDFTIDSAGIALRRAICTAIMLTGQLEDAFDHLREMNGTTLPPAKGDALNDDVLMRM